MSGVGKSTWSSRLEKEKGFKRYCCDDLIEKELSLELKELGYEGINDVSKWMGQPYDKRYKKNSQKYLELEAKVIRNILRQIKKAGPKENIAVDATGSIIYMPASLMSELKKETKIVYLETPDSEIEEMIKKYFGNSKPVIWRGIFKSRKNEENIQALKRCYANLLKSRKNKYEALAEVTINYRDQMDKKFTVDDLLKQI